MNKSSKSVGRAFLNLIKLSYCTHSTVYWGSLIIFRTSTTGTIPLTTEILRTSTKWRATSQTIITNM